MLPITNEDQCSNCGQNGLQNMSRGTLEKDECRLHGSICQSIIKVCDHKCTCFAAKGIKRNTFSNGLREKDVTVKDEAINQCSGKKQDLSQTEISHWIVSCDWDCREGARVLMKQLQLSFNQHI